MGDVRVVGMVPAVARVTLSPPLLLELSAEVSAADAFLTVAAGALPGDLIRPVILSALGALKITVMVDAGRHVVVPCRESDNS